MRLRTFMIYLILCLLGSTELFSQVLTFESQKFDFGTIAEDGGEVHHTFTYKNTGDSPAVIVTASSSCGCTVPSFSNRPIAAGESSTIEVAFDPMDRPGRFAKTVQVIIAPSNEKYTLTISGDVTPRKKSVEEQYPFDMGAGFRIAANYFPLSHIEQGERRETQLQYVNTSKRKITVSLRAQSESGVLQSGFPLTIEAGESGSVPLLYDLSQHVGRYGVLSDKFFIDVNGKESKYALMVNAHAVDRFTSDERERAAGCQLSSRIVKMGELKMGPGSSQHTLSIENTGVSPLYIRAIDIGEGVKSTLKVGDVVEAGAISKFEVWVETKEFDFGNFSRYITLTVNDPDDPLQRVRVTGIIME
ncbi:MAG: DUF1573 domain-containing protein [Rikenellaceae bacterium]